MALRLSVDNVNFRDNATSIIEGGGKVFATNLTVTNNGFTGPLPQTVEAVAAIRLRGTNLNVTNNSGFAIGAWSVRLFESVVTGNNGFGAGVDILSRARPQLNDATCGHSRRNNDTSLSWGVCTGDP